MTETTTRVTTAGGSAGTLVDLSGHRNNLSCTTTDSLREGRLNIWRNSLPQVEMPTAGLLEIHGVGFSLPRFDGINPDNVVCSGQHLACASGSYDWIYLLATSERRSEDQFSLHFADGSVDFESFRVSDFWHAEPAFGDRRAFGTTQMHYPFHVQPNLRGDVWFQRVPVTRMVPLSGVTLPDNVAIHLYAMTLIPSRLETFDA
ncbi:hypothetical protein [Nocardioides pantholopis]|uniref:hypothetical protein n=1 Tax=Nocardioides pantholopis TaxID=2483798 RepID=UPI000FD9B6FF|nr:hypothetical protein [Nocardioides pantholopis]